MNSLIDRVADLLYPSEGVRTLDIKFFSGGTQNVSATDLAEQVLRSQSQVENTPADLIEIANIDRHLI